MLKGKGFSENLTSNTTTLNIISLCSVPFCAMGAQFWVNLSWCEQNINSVKAEIIKQVFSDTYKEKEDKDSASNFMKTKNNSLRNANSRAIWHILSTWRMQRQTSGVIILAPHQGRCFTLLKQNLKFWREQQSLISGQWQKQSNWQSFDCENWYSGAYFHQGQWNVSYHAQSSLPRTHIEGCRLA